MSKVQNTPAIEKAKPIHEVYNGVKDFDVVVVPDGPLASGINKQIDKPYFGTFATTPRRLASGHREKAEDRQAFLQLIQETDLGWKQLAHTIGDVLQCWDHQGDIEDILSYDSHIDTTTEKVIDVMKDLDLTSRDISRYKIDDKKSVAVVGLERFTPLEKTVLPEEYQDIPLFTDKKYEIPEFQIFDSAIDIVDAVVESIDRENAENVAVVLDKGSNYSTLIESALETNDIPFYGGPGFIDNSKYRSYLDLLRIHDSWKHLTVKDIRPTLSNLDIKIDQRHDNRLISRLKKPELEWFESFTKDIDKKSFGQALTSYEEKVGELPRLRDELQRLGIQDQKITSSRVEELSFYFDSYEVPVKQENEGVLLADANSTGYVDRPTVFYLGIDENWSKGTPQRPWIDRDEVYDRNLSRFKQLIQSGDQQYFLVLDTEGGEPVTPCLYFNDLFNDLLDTGFEKFSDLPHTKHPSRTHSRNRKDSVEEKNPNDPNNLTKKPWDVETEEIDALSQSSLGNYVLSPKEYFFSRVLDSPARDYFEEGNLFHDFAELYANHPDFVDDEVTNEILDYMVGRTCDFYPDHSLPLVRRKYRIGVETIKAFLDENPPTEGTYCESSGDWMGNDVAEKFGKEIDSPLTERWFKDRSLGIKGMIDLVHRPDRLLDYKSGRKKRPTQILKNSSIEEPTDTPNYQAKLYLTHYRTEQPDEKLEFVFFNFLESIEELIQEDDEVDLDDRLTTVPYHPYTFDEYVGSREAYEELLDGYTDCRETFEDLGFPAYSDIMDQLSYPSTRDKGEVRNSEFATELQQAVDVATSKEVSDVEKGCDQAVRCLNGVHRSSYFREDLDEFEGYIEETIDEINRLRRENVRFPVEGEVEDPSYRYIGHRDLFLEEI